MQLLWHKGNGGYHHYSAIVFLRIGCEKSAYP